MYSIDYKSGYACSLEIQLLQVLIHPLHTLPVSKGIILCKGPPVNMQSEKDVYLASRIMWYSR